MANLSDKEREDLVAYLDGELDTKRARDVEAKISVDARFRAEVTALKQAWELLDFLPRPEASASFTHRTLERLAVTRRRPVRAAASARRRWALAAGWAAAVLVAAGVGFWAGGRLAPEESPAPPDDARVDEQLVRHLRVLQNRPLYELVDDLDLLQSLNAPDLFGDEQGS
jgi:anti-sigma factor RsiW